MVNSRYEIYDRIFDFVVSVIKQVKYFPNTETNKIIINQLLRSVTSIGANANEADGTSTKKDFIHCFTIVRKESKETIYWLKLLSETNSKRDFISGLINEGEEIVAVISKIILKTRRK